MTDTIQCNVLGMQKSTPDPNPRTGPNKKAHILHGRKQHQRQNQAETNEEEQTVRINLLGTTQAPYDYCQAMSH